MAIILYSYSYLDMFRGAVFFRTQCNQDITVCLYFIVTASRVQNGNINVFFIQFARLDVLPYLSVE